MAGALLAGLAMLLVAYFDSVSSVQETPAPPVAVPAVPVPPAAQPQMASTTLLLQAGQRRTVMLQNNAGTGFSWQLAEPVPEDAPVSAVLTGVEPDESNCCGFPVPVTLVVTALKPGKLTLRLIYSRPWEKDKAPAKVEIFEIEVRNSAS